MLRNRITTLTASCLFAFTCSGAAHAQQSFSTRAQVIRAGVVILENSRPSALGEPQSAAPHAWYNLDANRSVKPAGWNFVNPHAPSLVSAATYSRWTNIESTMGSLIAAPYRVPAVGTRVNKRSSAYWEVRLDDLTETQLSHYDVLLVNPLYNVQLTPSEREKLRRFVDRGGVLWIDPSALPIGTSIDLGNSFPIPFNTTAASTLAEYSDTSQPLLTTPQPLGPRDFNLLATTPDTVSLDRDIVPPSTALFSDVNAIFGESFSDFARLKPVIGVSASQFSVGLARIGDGFVVVTGRAVSLKLNRSVVEEDPQDFTHQKNLGYEGREPTLQSDGIAAARFAVNLVSLSREFSQPQGGSQKSNSSAVDVGAPLLRRATDTSVAGNQTAPVLYKGYLIATAGDVISVYDADPGRDIDGDGDPDDGAKDTGIEGRDLIWRSTSLGGTLSSPVCTEVPTSTLTRADGSIITDEILVTDNTGKIHALDLARYNTNGSLDGNDRGDITGYPLDGPASTGSYQAPDNGIPNPPTVHEGLAYVTDLVSSGTQGRIWMVDLASGTRPNAGARDWSAGGVGIALPPFSAAPTIGYIPVYDNSGGSDKVMYVSLKSQSSSAIPAGLASIWLGAKGEKPTSYEPEGPTATAATLQVTTRAAAEGLPVFCPTTPNPLGVRLTLLRADGTVYSAAQTAALFVGPPTQAGGILSFSFRGPTNKLPADVVGIRVDYNIDYGFGTGSELGGVLRAQVQIPDRPDSTTFREVIGSASLAPDGSVFFTTTAGTVGRSSLFGFREEGRGRLRCSLRYDLYGKHAFVVAGSSDFDIPPVVEDNDPVRNFGPGGLLAQPMSNFTFTGPPAIRNGVVYTVAKANKGFVPTTVAMAFRAEPETPSFYVGSFPPQAEIVQYDGSRSLSSSRPEIPSSFKVGVVSGNMMTYDETSQRIRLESLSPSTKDTLQQVINLSEPIIIRRNDGTPEEVLWPDGPKSRGGRYSPLLWYTVLQGFSSSPAGAVVTGDTFFLGGQSVVRNILTVGTLATEGLLYAIQADVSPNDPFLVTDTNRPWNNQFLQLKLAGGLQGNPGVKWPQFQGATSFEDYLVRLGQTVLEGSDNVTAIAAGEGILAAVGSAGLYTFAKSDFVVSDEGRVAAFDPSGNPTFSLRTSTSSGTNDAGTAGISKPLVRPTRSYVQPNGDILVVDTGGNRVFRVNRAGNETRNIDRFRVDPNITPLGFVSGAPLTLSGPRDATTYTSYETQANVEKVVSASGFAAEYWIHYLIADSGNRRLVELIDRYAYDPTTRRIGAAVKVGGEDQLAVLLWHSPTLDGTKGFDYNSISRVYSPGATPGTGQFLYFAGVGGPLPTTTDTGTSPPSATSTRSTSGFGGVVVFDPSTPNGISVFNSIAVPEIGANVFYDEAAGIFQSTLRPAHNQALVNVNSVTARVVSGSISVMITDANGVYEVAYTPGTIGATIVPSVQWMLPNEVYRVLRRTGANIPLGTNMPLRAMYARRLDSGEILLVNGYYGRNRDKQEVGGQILQLSGTVSSSRFTTTNMGFGTRSVTFELPPIQGARGLVLPVFADRR